MKHLLATSISIALLSLGLAGCGEKQATKEVTSDAFVTIQGQDLIKPDGTKLFIMGTNLGNWLNPEGYMFKFNKTNSGLARCAARRDDILRVGESLLHVLECGEQRGH